MQTHRWALNALKGRVLLRLYAASASLHCDQTDCDVNTYLRWWWPVESGCCVPALRSVAPRPCRAITHQKALKHTCLVVVVLLLLLLLLLLAG
jgi:hypothetical protein